MKPLKLQIRNRPVHNSMLLVTISSLFLAGVHARTWTSADGSKTFEGEIKSYDASIAMAAPCI
jgi:hypothetical protein